MKIIKYNTFKKWIKEGRIEEECTVGSSYVEIRWCSSGKRETVQVDLSEGK